MPKIFHSIEDIVEEQESYELCNCEEKNGGEQKIKVLYKAYCQGCGKRLLPCSFCYGYITENCRKCPFKKYFKKEG